MTGKPVNGPRVLMVDDDQAMCEMVDDFLGRRSCELVWTISPDHAIQLFSAREFDVALVDLNMPRITGIDLCRQILAMRPDVPVIVLTAFGSMESAIQAIRVGAYDYLTKPVELERLAITVSNAARYRAMRERIRILENEPSSAAHIPGLTGQSEPMLRLYEAIRHVAGTPAGVLVTGESGTGKELVARAIHALSSRSLRPFIPVNCAAIPASLLESTLFGHRKGAFTGAGSNQPGLFEQADGGTLLLDEIGEMPAALQVKLLRALEGGVIRPVGADADVSFDTRIIALTNQDLDAAVHAGRFRKDLFFRVNVVPLLVPPLRQRGTDVLLLANHFISHFAAHLGKAVAGLADNVPDRLLTYSWPGNVRELRNAVERAVVLTRYDRISLTDLPPSIRDCRNEPGRFLYDPGELPPLRELERRYIEHVLRMTAGNKTAAAQILGLDRATLYRKLGEADTTPNSL